VCKISSRKNTLVLRDEEQSMGGHESRLGNFQGLALDAYIASERFLM
jgi:hypothetical protein